MPKVARYVIACPVFAVDLPVPAFMIRNCNKNDATGLEVAGKSCDGFLEIVDMFKNVPKGNHVKFFITEVLGVWFDGEVCKRGGLCTGVGGGFNT